MNLAEYESTALKRPVKVLVSRIWDINLKLDPPTDTLSDSVNKINVSVSD